MIGLFFFRPVPKVQVLHVNTISTISIRFFDLCE